MFKKIWFNIKYKKTSDMYGAQYNEGLKHAQQLDLETLFNFLKQDYKTIIENPNKVSSLFKQIGEYDAITHIASCAIKPRFGKWKKHKRKKYCKDISKSINIAFELCAFFFSNAPLKLPNLANYLRIYEKI